MTKNRNIFRTALLLMLVMPLAFTNCKKNTDGEIPSKRNLTLSEYVKQAKKTESAGRAKALNAGARLLEKGYWIDYDNTVEGEVYDSATKEKQRFFLTKVYSDSDAESQIGNLVGHVIGDDQVFDVLMIKADLDNGETIVEADWLGGNELGSYTVNSEGRVKDIVIVRPGDTGGYVDVQRSWWACTMDCTGDAHIACYTSTECTTLLLVANIGGAAVSAAGIGSGSIFIACGAVCAKNRNLDLLPQH